MTALWTVLAVSLIALGYPLVRTYRRRRGPRIVRCPENGRTASIELDAPHATITQATMGSPILRVKRCSRWPRHQDCDQECLSQVEA
jgi:hypothetical protein